METHEVGAYILLLFTSFLEKKKGYLKNDDEYLRKITRLKKSVWKKSRDIILKKFKTDVDGYLYNEKFLYEIMEAEKSIKTNLNRTQTARKALEEKRLSQSKSQSLSQSLPQQESGSELSSPAYDKHLVKNSGWLSIDEYIEYREYEFSMLDENLVAGLKKNIGIDRPYPWCNRRNLQGYFDLVDCLIRVREDVEWRSSVQRNNNISKEKLLLMLYDFVKEIKDSKVYLGYDGYDSSDGKENFIAHFTRWLKLKLVK